MGTPSRVSAASIRNTNRTGSDVVMCPSSFPDAQLLEMVTFKKIREKGKSNRCHSTHDSNTQNTRVN